MLDILKEYTSKRIDLLKLEAAEKTSVTIGVLAFLIIVAAFGIFFIFMLNIGIGFLIGQELGNLGYGLLIMSAFYLLLLILVFSFKKKIKDSIANLIIDALTEED